MGEHQLVDSGWLHQPVEAEVARMRTVPAPESSRGSMRSRTPTLWPGVMCSAIYATQSSRVTSLATPGPCRRQTGVHRAAGPFRWSPT